MAKKIKARKSTSQNSKGAPIIINQIEVRPVNRQILDIEKWRTALKSADMGRRTALFNLYEDILTDGVLGDAIDKRIRAITGADITFQYADGSESEDMIDFIDTEDFEYLLIEVAKAMFWEISLIEPTFGGNGMQIYSVPRKHIRPETKTIAKMENDPVGNISYDGLDVIEVISREHKHGLILRACPYAIFKRGGIGDWAQMVELFGMPQRIGKYNIYDVEARKALQDAFNNQGAASTLIVPAETQIETTLNTGTAGGTLYKDFIATMDEQILITILSQTMTTKDGASRSQGQVHKEVEEEVNKHDLRFVQRVLNHKLKPILERRGFPVKDGSFVFPKAIEGLTIDQIISLSGVLPIPAYYVQERWGIPAAEKTDAILQRNQPEPGTDEPDNEKDKKPPKEKELSDTERSWFMRLFDFFAFAPTQRSGANQNFIAKWTNSITGTITNLSDRAAYGVDINALFNRAIEDIYRKHGHEAPSPVERAEGEVVVDKSLFDISNTAYQKAVDTQFAKAGAEFGKKNEAFINEFKHNAAVFASFKSHQQTKEIVAELLDENGDLRSFHDFKKAVLGSHIDRDYNHHWLKTEYNMAVRSARSAVQFKKFWGLKHLYPNLEYLESTAKKKRKEHLEYVGTILPIEHPWWNDHLPPVEWGCECGVRNTDKPETAVPDDNGAPINPVFANNPAKTAEIVNMEEHPYVKGVCKYFPTCTRRTGGSLPTAPSGLADNNGEPPIIPQCAICKMAADNIKAKQDVVDSRNKAKDWSEKNIPAGKPLEIKVKTEHIDRITLTRAIVKTILAKGHSDAVNRNRAVMNMKTLFKKAKYYGWAEDEIINGQQKHTDTDYWLYYQTKVGFVCVKFTKLKEYKPYAIVDKVDFEKIKGIKKENPIR